MRRAAWIWGEAVLLWAVAFLLSLSFRPLFPVDETRYVSVAWEMWTRGDFLVPHLNGELYGHKPPLLFWLMHAGWALFGVNEWWPRLVPALFALGNLYLCRVLARRLWPDRPEGGPLAALILASSALYFIFTGLVMFDMLVTFFTLLGVLGVLWAGQGGGPRAWILTGFALGLGILTKGPVIVIHILPVALLAPLWRSPDAPQAWGRWYLSVLGAVVLGTALALTWALSAAHRGGEAYAQEIFWSQTADRVVESFAHRRSWWWYLPVLPFALLPWVVWPPLLRALPRMSGSKADAGMRFLVSWLVPPFVALSLISGKNANYLLPLIPGFALLMARLLSERGSEIPSRPRMPGLIFAVAGVTLVVLSHQASSAGNLQPLVGMPVWPGILMIVAGSLLVWRPLPCGPRGFAAAMAGVYLALYLSLVVYISPAYDMEPVAERLKHLELAGIPVAHVGKYYGEFQFLGRLERPLPRIEPEEVESWLERHPQGRVVALASMWEPQDGRRPEYRQPYRSNTISMWARKPDS